MHSSYTDAACARIATLLDCNFSSSRIIAQKAAYLGNGTGDQCQTWNEYCNRGFHKKSHAEGFPNPVTYNNILLFFDPGMIGIAFVNIHAAILMKTTMI